MSFTPILNDQTISYVRYKTDYRNMSREAYWGVPVYFTPKNLSENEGGGYGGPRYYPDYNYDNSPETTHGNCTWWCCGRLKEAEGIQLPAGLGHGKDWYDSYSNIGGTVSTDQTSIVAGDIICLSGGSYGHVMFVEKVSGDTVYISESAWSDRSVWQGYACRVTNYTKTQLTPGNYVDMYKNIDTAPYNMKVIGFLKTGGAGPTPPTPTATLTIQITPSSYTQTMSSSQSYVDFPFSIVISGIPDGETVSGGNTYPGLNRVANTGWTYTDYQLNGVTYRYATKTQTLRYLREYNWGYTTTKYMYFNITKSTGTISSTTPMYITVQAKGGFNIASWILKRKKGKKGTYSIYY